MNSRVDANESDPWILAGQYASVIGKFPTFFGSCVRSLRDIGEGRGDRKISPELVFKEAAVWIGRSPTLISCFYFAAQSLYPEKLASLEKKSVRKLLEIFTPDEVATILGLSFLYRRLRKISDKEEWDRIDNNMRAHIEVGRIVGETIEGIGYGIGMLIAGMRFMGMAMFSIEHGKDFKTYRRKLEKDGTLFDTDYENTTWRCNSIQIAARTMQALGYGLDAAICMWAAGNEGGKAPFVDEKITEQELKCWKTTISWSESLHSTKGPPPSAENTDDETYLPDEAVKELQNQVSAVLSKESWSDWILKTASDLPPEVASAFGIKVSESSKSDQDLDEMAE